ncbi:MAG: IclR family transcriptional regulator [Umezawaea sp.]
MPRDPSDAPPLLVKAARILNAFEGQRSTLTLTDVVRHSGLSQTTVHRLMDQLVQVGWLEREGREYRLGLRLLELGAFASHHNRLRRAALPQMIALHQETGHWIHLFVLDGPEVVCLEQIGDPRESVPPFQVGGRLPAHCTASGKVLLGFGGPAVEPHVAGEHAPRTRRTITRADTLRTELVAVRDAGVAFDRGECFHDVTCVAAPLRGGGRALAAISISRLAGYADLDRLAPRVTACTRLVWASMFGAHRRVEDTPAEPVAADDSETVGSWLRFSEWG